MAKGSNAVVAKDKKTLKYSKKQYLKWYEEMLLYRKFEEKASACYIQQKIRGFCHLYIGQEAIIAGYETSLGKGDSVITTYLNVIFNYNHSNMRISSVLIFFRKKTKAFFTNYGSV